MDQLEMYVVIEDGDFLLICLFPSIPTVLARKRKEESGWSALKGSDFESQEMAFLMKIQPPQNMIWHVLLGKKNDINATAFSILKPKTWGSSLEQSEQSPVFFVVVMFPSWKICTKVPLEQWILSFQVRFHQKSPANTNSQATFHRHIVPSHLPQKPAKSLRLYGKSFSWNSNSCLWIYVFLYLGCLCAGSMVRLRYLGTNGKGSGTSSKYCGWEQLSTSATRIWWVF